MRLQLRCHGDIDLSQPGMQVEIRSHIARCLRDYRAGRIWQKTWKIALAPPCRPRPLRHSVRFRYRPSNSVSGSLWASPSFTAASPISRAPSSLALRFDITPPLTAEERPRIGQAPGPPTSVCG